MSYFINKYEELFKRDCTYVSNLDTPITIKNFINGLYFEWKFAGVDLYNIKIQFALEIIDVPNSVLGLPYINNWHICTINIDPNSFVGEISDYKRQIIENIAKFVDVNKLYSNRFLIFTLQSIPI